MAAHRVRAATSSDTWSLSVFPVQEVFSELRALLFINHKHRYYNHVADFVTKMRVHSPNPSCSYTVMLPEQIDVRPN
jgi:hypothetical protein